MGTLEDGLKAIVDKLQNSCTEEQLATMQVTEVDPDTREWKVFCPCGNMHGFQLNMPPRAAEQVGAILKGGGEALGGFFSYKTDGRSIEDHRDAIYRHLVLYENGHKKDADSGFHPLAHVIARWLIVLDMELDETRDQVS